MAGLAADTFLELEELEECPEVTEEFLRHFCDTEDLSTGLKNVKFLWMNRCGLKDLGGINALPDLEELYVSFNEIRDLSPLRYHDTLQLLDVEANLVSEWEDIEGLAGVSTLAELAVQDNPICRSHPNIRWRIVNCLKTLVFIDSESAESVENLGDAAGDSQGSGGVATKLDAGGLGEFDDASLRGGIDEVSGAAGNASASGAGKDAAVVAVGGRTVAADPNAVAFIKNEPDEHELIAEAVKGSRKQFWLMERGPGGLAGDRPLTSFGTAAAALAGRRACTSYSSGGGASYLFGAGGKPGSSGGRTGSRGGSGGAGGSK
eukprot:gene289-47_t